MQKVCGTLSEMLVYVIFGTWNFLCMCTFALVVYVTLPWNIRLISGFWCDWTGDLKQVKWRLRWRQLEEKQCFRCLEHWNYVWTCGFCWVLVMDCVFIILLKSDRLIIETARTVFSFEIKTYSAVYSAFVRNSMLPLIHDFDWA